MYQDEVIVTNKINNAIQCSIGSSVVLGSADSTLAGAAALLSLAASGEWAEVGVVSS